MENAHPALIDIGANLSHSSFQHDLETVLEQAQAAGVAHIIVTGTDLESIRSASKLHERFPDYLSYTAGFHPHVASDFTEEARSAVHQYGSKPSVVAIGETGLDFNRNYSPRKAQEHAFASQLEIACEVQKPVFLHQRDAHDSFHAILRSFRDKLPGGVVHCFTDTKNALYDYLDLDMYIGITGWVCDERRGKDLQQLLTHIPSQRLLLETDAPYLLPRTLKPTPKSRRNEPKFLREVLDKIAHCTGIDKVSLASSTSANASRLFGIPLEHQGILGRK